MIYCNDDVLLRWCTTTMMYYYDGVLLQWYTATMMYYYDDILLQWCALSYIFTIIMIFCWILQRKILHFDTIFLLLLSLKKWAKLKIKLVNRFHLNNLKIDRLRTQVITHLPNNTSLHLMNSVCLVNFVCSPIVQSSSLTFVSNKTFLSKLKSSKLEHRNSSFFLINFLHFKIVSYDAEVLTVNNCLLEHKNNLLSFKYAFHSKNDDLRFRFKI